MIRQALFMVAVGSFAVVAHGAEPVRAPAERIVRDGRTVLKAHDASVADVAFSADGRRLASISRTGETAIWDVGAWTRQVFAAPGEKKYSVPDRTRHPFLAFASTGDELISGSMSQIFVWGAKSDRPQTLGAYRNDDYTPGLVVSADGRIAAVWRDVGAGGTVVLADTAKASTLCEFNDDTQRPNERQLALSPDGSLLAMACDAEVRLFDVMAKTELSPIKGLQGVVKQLLFSPDGAQVWCFEPNRLSVFTVPRQKGALPQFKFREEEQSRNIDSASFLAGGKTLAFIRDEQIVLWDVATRKVRSKIAGGNQLVTTADAKTLVSLAPGFGEKIMIADGETGVPLDGLDVPLAAGESNPESKLALSPDGALLVVGNRQGEIVLFELGAKPRSSAEPQVVSFDVAPGSAPDANARLQFSPSGKLLVLTVLGDATVFDIPAKAKRTVLEDPSWPNYGLPAPGPLMFAADERHASCISTLRNRSYNGGWQNRFVVLDLQTGKPTRVGTEFFSCIAASPDGKHVAVTTAKTVELRGAGSGQTELTLWADDRASDRVKSLQFSPDGALVAAVIEGTVKLWQTTSGEEHPTQAEGAGIGTSFCGNDTLVVVPDGRSMRFYDVASGSLRGELLEAVLSKAHSGSFTRLFVCETQPLIVTFGANGEALVRDLTSGKVLGRCVGHTGDVYTAAFSRDGQWLATLAADKTLRVWNVAALRQ